MSPNETLLPTTAEFAALHARHDQVVRAICDRIARDAVRGRELAQDAWVRIWEQRAHLATVRDEGAWVRTVTTNVARNAGRGARRRLVHEVPTDVLPDAGGDTVHPLATPLPIRRLELEHAIASLPEKARTIYLLHEIEGLGHAEVAARIGVAEGTVRGQLHRARALLRASLDASTPPAPVSSRRLRRGLPAAAAALALLAGTATFATHPGFRSASLNARATTRENGSVATSTTGLEQGLDEDRLLLRQIDAMLPGRDAADVRALQGVRRRLSTLVTRVEGAATPPIGTEERARLERERTALHQALRDLAR